MALQIVETQVSERAATPYRVEKSQALPFFYPLATATYSQFSQSLPQFKVSKSDNGVTSLYIAEQQIKPETYINFNTIDSSLQADSTLISLTQLSPDNPLIPTNNAHVEYDGKHVRLTSGLMTGETSNPQIGLIQLMYYESLDDGREMQIRMALDRTVANWLVAEGYFADSGLLDLTVIHTPQKNRYFIESRAEHKVKIELEKEDIAQVLKIDMPEIAFDDEERKIEVQQGGLHLLLHPGSLGTDFARRIADGKYIFDVEATLDERNLLMRPPARND